MLTTFLICLSIISVVTAWSLPSRISRRSALSMVSDGRRPLIGGNWKLNPTTIASAKTLVDDLVKLTSDVQDVDAVIFPPFPLLSTVHSHLQSSKIHLGAQDMFYETSGAYTGAVSTNLLKEVGVSHVLIGHSERRTIFKEDDTVINKKVKKALKDGLKPVLCIGESKEEYEAGLNQQVCAIQLLKDLQDVTPEEFLNVVIAYEPVWAIGTGLVCPKEVAQDIHAYIRSLIRKKYGDDIAKKTIIQYGGSVNVANIKDLMAQPDIDGALVGGASLTADGFSKIIGYQKL